LFLVLAGGCGLGLWFWFRQPSIEWARYSSATLAERRERGKRVLVVYHGLPNLHGRVHAFSAFDEYPKEIGGILRRMDIVAMDADAWDTELTLSEDDAIRRDFVALGEDPTRFGTLIVIYDNRARPTVIRDPGMGTHDYAAHVLEKLREYERSGDTRPTTLITTPTTT
jgi:hypothetical protein